MSSPQSFHISRVYLQLKHYLAKLRIFNAWSQNRRRFFPRIYRRYSAENLRKLFNFDRIANLEWEKVEIFIRKINNKFFPLSNTFWCSRICSNYYFAISSNIKMEIPIVWQPLQPFLPTSRRFSEENSREIHGKKTKSSSVFGSGIFYSSRQLLSLVSLNGGGEPSS